MKNACCLMVPPPGQGNGAPPRDRSNAMRSGLKSGFGVNAPRHCETVRSAGLSAGLPSAARHGELKPGSVRPSEKFSFNLVAAIDPPNFRLCAPVKYDRSAFTPKFVR